jgi:hypothetical protein
MHFLVVLFPGVFFDAPAVLADLAFGAGLGLGLVAGALEDGAAGALPLGGNGGGTAALVGAVAGGRSGLVLRGQAAVDADVVEVGELICVLGDEGVGGVDEDVVTGGGGVVEVGRLVALAGGEEVEAAAVLGGGVTGARARGLPLVDVLATLYSESGSDVRTARIAVRILGDERVGGLEEDAIAGGGEVAGQDREAWRLDGELATRLIALEDRSPERRGAGGVA